ncbi:MAG: SUMF1/EgtB/PvdO family nonheme iron enzyme [Planctomycetaceae bacterium]|jgi:formylglycine-generating enzyme required for sulfatase activity|nr:SUMF1/EgtB/PvdO family nonheme iron enzyme [Planctomycetaceae bacterium]
MTQSFSRFCLAAVIFETLFCLNPAWSQVKKDVRLYPDSGEFAAVTEEIQKNHVLNFLAHSQAKLIAAEGVSSAPLLIDGDAGQLGGDGRVTVSGKPSRIVYSLGRPCSIKEIVIWSANIDSRSHQDFEIRLAKGNPDKPGQVPVFPAEATLTSGDKVLGANRGAVGTRFFDESGKTLFDEKYDWVEFRIWRTYPSRAGDPAKENSKAQDWSSYVELQVLGDINDPSLFASEEERQAWILAEAKKRADRRLRSLGDEIYFAVTNTKSLKRYIEDMWKNFPDVFDTEKELARWSEFEKQLNHAFQTLDMTKPEEVEKILLLAKDYDAFRREILLKNPLLQFDKLLVRRSQNDGLVANWVSNASRGKGNYGAAVGTFSPKDAQSPMTIISESPNGSFIGDVCLHWDGKRALVTALGENKTWQVHELNLENGALRQVTPFMASDIDNVEGIYMPDGAVTFISTASMMGVPCVNGSDPVGNIYRLEPDGKTVRQLTFEQDQDWCPTLLHNGRILYLRWEYTDIGHYFTRIMFHMNPDGTNQTEYYGSGSYWPNSLFYAKPVAGHATKFVGIVSGHHGVARAGELVIFDPSKGRRETDGVVQRIPGYGQTVEPVIADELVQKSWPRFLFPWALNENYYLVSCKMNSGSPWAIYLVDTWDNMLKLREEPGYGLFEPMPLRSTKEPPTIASRVESGRKDASVFITDVYTGPGLQDVPRGAVTKLRVFAYSYGYRGMGGHDAFGMESAWDGRRMLGEVPVYEDGSAFFEIPSNTPISLQPLDSEGRAVQLMRSWVIGMPGENVSCVGCHEQQNTITPTKFTLAANHKPGTIEPFYGPERPFSFEGEIQPVLNKYCTGCHDDSKEGRPNFADASPGPEHFSKSYHALSAYVRRPGPESDIYMFRPMEYHATTSELFQILKKGHHEVELDEEAWRKLYCWADLNVPFFGTWSEIVAARQNENLQKHIAAVSSRHADLKKLYGENDLDFESGSFTGYGTYKNVSFLPPKELPKPDFSAPKVPHWPMTPEEAAAAQKLLNRKPQTVKVGELSIELVPIPSGSFVMGDECGNLDELPRSAATVEKPFWMMTTEVTNELYHLFEPGHDSRYIDQWHKDHTTPGYPANKPKQPVIRVSWKEANQFCQWLSQKTGKTFRLPTEAEWEWACRAGTDSPMWYGNLEADFGKLENMSDESTRLFVVRGVNPQPVSHQDYQAFIPRAVGIKDGNMIAQEVGSYTPNLWGLFDMHGSVAEWTLSDYKPYPYQAEDGRNSGDSDAMKVARGGSWRDRPIRSRAGFRLNYQPWQKVFNVGFRVVMEE